MFQRGSSVVVQEKIKHVIDNFCDANIYELWDSKESESINSALKYSELEKSEPTSLNCDGQNQICTCYTSTIVFLLCTPTRINLINILKGLKFL